MNGYRFSLACPVCGGVLAHLASSTRAGTETCATARCDSCRRDWLVSVFLRPARAVGGRPRRRAVAA